MSMAPFGELGVQGQLQLAWTALMWHRTSHLCQNVCWVVDVVWILELQTETVNASQEWMIISNLVECIDNKIWMCRVEHRAMAGSAGTSLRDSDPNSSRGFVKCPITSPSAYKTARLPFVGVIFAMPEEAICPRPVLIETLSSKNCKFRYVKRLAALLNIAWQKDWRISACVRHSHAYRRLMSLVRCFHSKCRQIDEHLSWGLDTFPYPFSFAIHSLLFMEEAERSTVQAMLNDGADNSHWPCRDRT